MKNKKEYQPCIVYGDSGCGKTSVLAKTATEVRLFNLYNITKIRFQVFKWWSGRSVSVVLRFLGFVKYN